MVWEEFDKEYKQIHDVEMRKKEESREGKLYQCIRGISTKIKIISILNDKMKESKVAELREAIEQLHLEVVEYGDDTVLGRFWMFLEQEVNAIYKNNDIKKIDEFNEMISPLKNFIWSQIPVEEEQERRKKYSDALDRRVTSNYKIL